MSHKNKDNYYNHTKNTKKNKIHNNNYVNHNINDINNNNNIIDKNSNIINRNNNKKFHLIFDLDETLIQSIQDNINLETKYMVENTQLSQIAFININNIFKVIYIRPFCLTLLDFCYKHFDVSFWTSGTHNYCRGVINTLLNETQKQQTKFIIAKYNKDKNKIINLKSNKVYDISKFYPNQQKPLIYLWKHPDFNKYLNQNNTILIDNSIQVVKPYLDNSILVYSYCRLNHQDDVLNTLKDKLSIIFKTNKKITNFKIVPTNKQLLIQDDIKKVRQNIITDIKQDELNKYY